VSRLASALACATLALLAGCGGDDEPAATTPPTPTEVETQPRSTDTTEQAAPQPTAPEPVTPVEPAPAPEPESAPQDPLPSDPGSSGGAPAPPADQPEDSPENDTPPPPGSPAERFEQECERNPETCG